MKSFKYRLYPTNRQQVLLAKHLGATHFGYNYFLAQRRDYYLEHKEDIQQKNIKGSLNYYDNAKELTQLKQQEATIWLKEINAQSLQACLKDLEGAYRPFSTTKPSFLNSRKNTVQPTVFEFRNMFEWKKIKSFFQNSKKESK